MGIMMMGERARHIPGDAVVAGFEPGDGTHYEFMWMRAQTGFVRVAGTPDLRMYEYNIESIKRCYEEHRDLVGTKAFPVEEPYIGYVVEHSKCNPWTAWAMVQCIAEKWILDGDIVPL